MTCIGAIREVRENGIISITLAADSCVSGNRILAEHNSNSLKTFKKSNITIACVGTLRYCDILKYRFLPPDRETDKNAEEYLAMQVIPAIIQALKDNRRIMNTTPDGEALIIYEGRLFKIGENFSLTEFKEYTAIGFGSRYMVSALYETQNMQSAKERLELGLETASIFDLYKTKPFCFETIKFKTINFKEENRK